MEAQEFAVVQAQLMQTLTRLSGGQVDMLRQALAQCTSLRDCLAIIEERGAKIRCCPHCAGDKLYRHGVYYGLQRYRCRQCRRSFNALTNTPLAFIRLRDKWLPFLQCMLGSMTVRAAAATTGIHRNTSFRWRHRFLAMAKDDRPRPLQGVVEVDETYLLESQKGSRHLTRPARRRGGKSRRRGINSDYDCIVVARERGGRTCDFVTGRGARHGHATGDMPAARARTGRPLVHGWGGCLSCIHEGGRHRAPGAESAAGHPRAWTRPRAERQPLSRRVQGLAVALSRRCQSLSDALPGLDPRARL